ncbi:hypothetical protein Cylst_5109 [Cylindrospermum stagnale PCC 7417]|uniref:Uncharacterized protein n=1 Tax=Cylindrospermum stagnale PCC 7417 TaxID=56107 RepID=K9X4X8_9NOST|nr:hypothetical protein Cylst_5109 [Cylindrospermum stagnale PCC 7417]
MGFVRGWGRETNREGRKEREGRGEEKEGLINRRIPVARNLGLYCVKGI